MNTKIISEFLSDEDESIQDKCIVRLKFVQTMAGDELIDFIGKDVDADINKLKNQLSCYDTASLFGDRGTGYEVNPESWTQL
ncbi:MAG: hypothetical protein II817_00425 [Bacteroidales bacterium]|nr:hypothetical protein [Bacteroidales bacterium]